jgi:hypothetical protein
MNSEMASDLERDLLASDNEATIPTAIPATDRSAAASVAAPLVGAEHLFQQFAQILDNKLDRKLASFKRSFAEKEEQHASQLKKLKTESKAASSFKFKGNKIQYEFNVATVDSLEVVSKSLLEGDLSKASTEIEKQKALIQKRNKLIRFADKSPAGWSAVDEYESDDLAENSEDEKRLRSAERRAMAKIKSDKQSRRSTNVKREQSSQRPSYTQAPAPPISSQTFRGLQSFRQPFRGSRYPQPGDKCFSCGQYGHWASSPSCVNRGRSENLHYPSSSSSKN